MKALIVAIVVIGLAVVIGTIFIGSKTFDGTVVDKPYDKGIKYDKTQKALKDYKVVVENEILGMGKNTIVFSIKSDTKDISKISDAVVTITKPTTTKFDWNYEAIRQPDGKYQALIELPDRGQWEIRVVFNVEGEVLTYPFLYNVR